LNSRAAGESLVRQALSELEQWEVESHWTLVMLPTNILCFVTLLYGKQHYPYINITLHNIIQIHFFTFSFQAQHVDSNGILLFIIKEFKELLNKVEINIIIQNTPFPNKNIVQTGWREYEPYTVRQGFILLSGIQRPDNVVGNQND
jgi:hypothetical protein